MDPRAMQKLMKQMGIKSEQIDADKVIIETKEENIIIKNPQVTKVIANGTEVFQISGTVVYEEKINEEDVELVMQKANVSREEAIEALKETNSIAEAILKLKEQ